MKNHLKLIMLLSMCVGSLLHAMDGENHEHDNTRAVPLEKRGRSLSNPQLGQRGPCVGYAVFGNKLVKLKARVDRYNALFQGPLNVHYEKYKKKYDDLDMEKNDIRIHKLCMHWAHKVRDLEEASYSTIFVRAYPKRIVGVIIFVVTAGLTAGGYFLCEAYKEYTQKQQAAQQESANNADTSEQPNNLIT